MFIFSHDSFFPLWPFPFSLEKEKKVGSRRRKAYPAFANCYAKLSPSLTLLLSTLFSEERPDPFKSGIHALNNISQGKEEETPDIPYYTGQQQKELKQHEKSCICLHLAS